MKININVGDISLLKRARPIWLRSTLCTVRFAKVTLFSWPVNEARLRPMKLARILASFFLYATYHIIRFRGNRR